MDNYRKLWEESNGPIPFDSSGRRMEIHHRDGDRTNNSLENLMLVTIEEHYQIHHAQGDWAACQAIMMRMALDPETIRETCSALAKKRIADGTHHFIDKDFIAKDSERKKSRTGEKNSMWGKNHSDETRQQMSETHRASVVAGTHHTKTEKFKDQARAHQREKIERNIHEFQRPETRQKIKEKQLLMIEEGSHPLAGPNRKDPNKMVKYCKVCCKEVSLPAFGKYHKHDK